MSKKLVSIVAIIALVAVLGVVFCACNADSYQKKLEKAGYTVETLSEDDVDEWFGDEADVEWAVCGLKINSLLKADGEMVYIVKFADSEDAKDAEKDAKDGIEDGWDVSRIGKIVIFGTEQGVKDAK